MSDTSLDRPSPPPFPKAPPPLKRSRMGLFLPFILFAVGAAGWCGYWFYAADSLKAQVTAQATALRQDGYVVEYAPLKVQGFPFRLHLPLTDFTLITPSKQGFSAALVDAESMAYAPGKWVVSVPGPLIFHRGLKDGVDRGTVDLVSDNLRLSVSGLGKSVPSWAIVGTNMTATASNPAFPFTFEKVARFEVYSRPNVVKAEGAKETQTPDAFDFLFRLTDATGGPNTTAGKASPGAPFSLHLEGTVHTASALKGGDTTEALTRWSAAKGQINQFKGSAQAGGATLLLSSQTLSLDENRALTGYMDVELDGAGKPFEIMNGLGLISTDEYPQIEPLLGITLNTNGPRKLTLGFREGRVWLGPINLSKAPVFP